MKHLKYSVPVILLIAKAFTVPAQIDTIVRAFVDQAARNQRHPQQPQRRQQQPKQQSTVSRQPKKRVDGTWLATQSKTNPAAQQTSNRSFILISTDEQATKTLAAIK